jgi:hypothetical protein
VGRQLLLELGPLPVKVPLVMDRAYEGDETRQLVLELNMIPVVPPKSNRLDLRVKSSGKHKNGAYHHSHRLLRADGSVGSSHPQIDTKAEMGLNPGS